MVSRISDIKYGCGKNYERDVEESKVHSVLQISFQASFTENSYLRVTSRSLPPRALTEQVWGGGRNLRCNEHPR